MKILKIAIVLFWVGMMGLLLREKFFLEKTGSLEPFSLKEGDYWIGVLYQGKRAGFFHIVNTFTSMQVEGELYLNFLGKRKSLKLNGCSILATDGAIKGFSFRLISGKHKFLANGTSWNGDGFLVRIKAGDTSLTEFKINRNISIRDFLLPDFRLAAGERRKFTAFNPITGIRETACIEVLRLDSFQGSDVKIVDLNYAGSSSRLWITDDGEILKAETPLGFTLVREKREDAVRVREIPSEELVDVLSTVAVDAGAAIENPASVKKMVVKIGGFDLDKYQLESERQKVTGGGVIEVSRAFPPGNILMLPASEDGLKEFLSPSLLVDSDDSSIVKQAGKIVEKEKNSWKASKRINDWVFNNIYKVPVPGVPSSVEVLATREGDCNEHTFLFVALARSAGIPSEICTGLTYYEGKFYYHSWPKVFVGHWVEMDPTLGQTFADATHIKLIEGGLEKQLALARIVGKIKLEIVELEYD